MYGHTGAGGNGIIATRKLYEYALNQGAEFQFDTAVVALVLKNETSSEVAGVIAEQDGVLYAFKANRGVILSAASIDQNVALALAVRLTLMPGRETGLTTACRLSRQFLSTGRACALSMKTPPTLMASGQFTTKRKN